MKKITKTFTILTILIILTSLSISLFRPAVNDQDAQKLNITMAGGSPNGTLYMVLSGVAECVNRSFPGSVVMIVPGSGTGNLFRINESEVDAGASHSVIAYSAMKGEGVLDRRLDNLAAVASLYPSTLQIVVNKKLGLKSFDEIIEQKTKLKISVDQPGSTASITFERLLGEYGVSVNDFNQWGGEILYKNMSDSADMLADGRIDAMSISTLYPAPAILENSLNSKYDILEINANIIDRMIKNYHYYETFIPAGTYPFLKKDISTIACSTIIVVPRNASDELTYKLAASVTENIDYLQNVHIALNHLTPPLLTENLGIPLHPGAERYYREKGIIK